MVIPLLGVKTRCADKSTAEHYEHTYIHTYGVAMKTDHIFALLCKEK